MEREILRFAQNDMPPSVRPTRSVTDAIHLAPNLTQAFLTAATRVADCLSSVQRVFGGIGQRENPTNSPPSE